MEMKISMQEKYKNVLESINIGIDTYCKNCPGCDCEDEDCYLQLLQDGLINVHGNPILSIRKENRNE